MRIRTVLTACAAVLLLSGAQPASAGTGSSTFCDDHNGTEIVILRTPVTVGLEISEPPGGNHQQLIVCYGTGAEAQPTTGTGGAVLVDLYTTTSTVYPGAFVHLMCFPDYAVGFAPACDATASADLALDDVRVTTPPSTFCLVGVDTGCSYYAPGVMVADGNPGRALIQIRLLGLPVDVGAPRCVSLIVACPS